MTFAFIEAEKASFPIAFMCKRLGVSTSGFFEWRHARAHPCRRRVEDAELLERIREIHRMSRRSYGSPRVFDELRLGEGRRVGRKRIERLMRLHGIVGIHKRRRGCTRRDPDAEPGEDLVNRNFAVDGPDRLWVSDISEHPTGEGKVYIAVVLDAWSRRVIGWSIADHIRAELVVDALQMAHLAAPAARGPDRAPLRPRLPVHVLGVRATPARRRHPRFHGIDRRRL